MPAVSAPLRLKVGRGGRCGQRWCSVGHGSVIGSGSVVGPGVSIGESCYFGYHVSLRSCAVGHRVILHPGVKIGQDGEGLGSIISLESATVCWVTCVPVFQLFLAF